ncbi:MAG: type IX secretion system membrane protein PorP/SprF [Sediminibacterium sp.]|nr:type IX secretion system membrane protein PorP/SprF [Sediminibacterium sp.]
MKKYKLIFILIIVGLSVQAQQAPMYTHYMYNTLVVNPAYAGSRDALTITALNRAQWVDYKGAPITQTITAHTPLRNEHIGLGLSVLNDKIGPSNNTSVSAYYAFIMQLNDKAKLALGLSAGVNFYQARLNTLLLDQQSDPAFLTNIKNHATPNFGLGAYYSTERFYAGVSVPYLLQNSNSAINQYGGNITIEKEQRHYFFIAGAVIPISENVAFKPTTFVKVTAAAPIEADITASFILMRKLLIGVMYRTGDAFGGLAGYDITEQFHFGYSYDWSFGLKTNVYNQGSHELILRYDILSPNQRQIHSPRNF